MRQFLDITETLAPTAELIDLLHEWMRDYREDYAHDGSRNDLCDRIIAAAKDYPVEYRGVLYRGTAIPDHVARVLQRGGIITLEPLPQKLMSWTKDIHIAELFADNQVGNNFSTAILAYDISALNPVVDMDHLYDNDPDTGHESEILAHRQTLTIRPRNVVALWVYDEDEEESVQVK